MQKEKKMTHIQIRIEESLKDQVQREASELGLSLSAWIRMKIIESLREKGEKKS